MAYCLLVHNSLHYIEQILSPKRYAILRIIRAIRRSLGPSTIIPVSGENSGKNSLQNRMNYYEYDHFEKNEKDEEICSFELFSHTLWKIVCHD